MNRTNDTPATPATPATVLLAALQAIEAAMHAAENDRPARRRSDEERAHDDALRGAWRALASLADCIVIEGGRAVSLNWNPSATMDDIRDSFVPVREDRPGHGCALLLY